MVIWCCSTLCYFCVRNHRSYKFLNWTIPLICDLLPFLLKNLRPEIKALMSKGQSLYFTGFLSVIGLISVVIHIVYFVFVAHIFTNLFPYRFLHFSNSDPGKNQVCWLSSFKAPFALYISSGSSNAILERIF